MAQLLRARKIPGVLLLHPLLQEQGYADYAARFVHHELVELGTRIGLDPLDLLPVHEFVSTPQLMLHPHDPWHPNALGHHLVAEAIFDYLVKKGLVAQPRLGRRGAAKLAKHPPDRLVGWGKRIEIDQRSARIMAGATASVALEFLPPEDGASLQIDARRATEDQSNEQVDVLVNKWYGGTLKLEHRWQRFTFPLAPKMLRRGINMISFRPAQDRTKTVSVVERVAVAPLTGQARIDMTWSSASSPLLSGFARGDQENTWNPGPVAGAELYLDPVDSPYRLRLHVATEPQPPPWGVRLRVLLNGQQVDSYAVPSRWHVHEVAVPRDLLKNGRNDLQLRFGPLHERKAAGARKDDRKCPAGFDFIELVPDPPETPGSSLATP